MRENDMRRSNENNIVVHVEGFLMSISVKFGKNFLIRESCAIRVANDKMILKIMIFNFENTKRRSENEVEVAKKR